MSNNNEEGISWNELEFLSKLIKNSQLNFAIKTNKINDKLIQIGMNDLKKKQISEKKYEMLISVVDQFEKIIDDVMKEDI